MNELLPLFLRTGNKEALFAVFWATLGREPGKLTDVDFATLRDLAERRGVKLTESQVRKRVDELKKLGILDVAPRRERGRFDLYVYRPIPTAPNETPKPEPATPLFDAAFGVGVESFAKPSDAAPPTVPVFATVSETETRTEANPVAESPTSPSEAARADALLARSPFAEALRRAIWPKDYEAIAWKVRCYQRPPEGFSDAEHDAMDSRVCELYVESRRIADEFEARSQRGEYADVGGSERCDAEREAALRAFAATRNPAIAPTVPAVSLVAAEHFRDFTKMIQPPEFAEVRGVRSTPTIPAVASVAAAPESTEPFAAPLEEINIKNKTINKPAKDFGAEAQASVDAPSIADVRLAVEAEAPKVAASRPDVAEVRALVDFASPKVAASRPDVAEVRALVDFASPKVAALRREIVDRVWEPTVHPDLIDRLTAAVALRVGGATRSTVFALIREACDAKSLFERSNGRVGKRTIWETAALRTKRLFENAGWRWSPTRFADEPRPSRSPVAPVVLDVERKRTTRTSSATTERSVAETPSVEELATTAAGFDASELDLPFADFSRLVARRRGIADACESRGVALEIRNALRELAKRELATA